MEQRVYAALKAHGPKSDPQLRALLGSSGSGPRDALAKLLPIGVVRHAGRASTPGKAMLYEATPAPEVEEAAERYAVRKPQRTKRARVAATPRLAELRRMEAGDFRQWHAARQRVLSQTKLLYKIDKMAFWESAPADELQLVLEEVVELRAWCDDVIAAIGERREHEAVKAKVTKLRATAGRTAPEQETAGRLADKISRKLISQD
ncbi:MAG: hypothetical protein M3389_13615 [Actinomycetota bacterium]|nr:hypothetical protein [Actinomycetota bacterium]